MSEMERARTPEMIGAEIRMYVDAGRRVTLLCGIEIGRRLVEAKELLPHGEWLGWLARETEFSDRSAQRYMRVFEEYGAAQLGLFGPETNATTLSDLPISKALLLLSVPESEREEFAAEVGAEALSTRELEQAIKDRQAAERRASEAERALHELEESEGLAVADLEEKLDEAREKLRRAEAEARRAAEGVGPYRERAEEAEQAVAALREQVRELEARPVATVTVRDEAAIEEAVRVARAKAESDAAERLNDLQKKLAAATKAKEKAEKEAKKAAKDAKRAAEGVGPYKEKAEAAEKEAAAKIAAAEQEAAAARAALEDARKKLKASSANVTKFGVYFKAVQEDFNKALEVLPEIGEADAETAEKLRKGMRVLVVKMLERIGE